METSLKIKRNPDWVLVKRRVKRIGELRLWYDTRADEWYVTLDNRTYHNAAGPLRPEQLAWWRKELGL